MDSGAARESQGSAGPGFVARERARFVRGETPLLTVAAGAETESLPALRLEGDGAARCEGWRLVAQLTMCVVDGPGEAGFLVQAAAQPGDVEDQGKWVQSVEAAGGAVVVAADEIDAAPTLEALAARPDARGGFVSLTPQRPA